MSKDKKLESIQQEYFGFIMSRKPAGDFADASRKLLNAYDIDKKYLPICGDLVEILISSKQLYLIDMSSKEVLEYASYIDDIILDNIDKIKDDHNLETKLRNNPRSKSLSKDNLRETVYEWVRKINKEM